MGNQPRFLQSPPAAQRPPPRFPRSPHPTISMASDNFDRRYLNPLSRRAKRPRQTILRHIDPASQPNRSVRVSERIDTIDQHGRGTPKPVLGCGVGGVDELIAHRCVESMIIENRLEVLVRDLPVGSTIEVLQGDFHVPPSNTPHNGKIPSRPTNHPATLPQLPPIAAPAGPRAAVHGAAAAGRGGDAGAARAGAVRLCPEYGYEFP